MIWLKKIKAASEQRHGTILVIMPEENARAEVERLGNLGYGLPDSAAKIHGRKVYEEKIRKTKLYHEKEIYKIEFDETEFYETEINNLNAISRL